MGGGEGGGEGEVGTMEGTLVSQRGARRGGSRDGDHGLHVQPTVEAGEGGLAGGRMGMRAGWEGVNETVLLGSSGHKFGKRALLEEGHRTICPVLVSVGQIMETGVGQGP